MFDQADRSRITGALRPLPATVGGLPLTLAGPGFFLTDEAPAVLAVVPTARLLQLHRQVHEALDPIVDGIWPCYRPDAMVPHCTLATGATDRTRVIDVVATYPMPIPALASAAYLVDLPGGRTRTSLTADSW
ncbi:2'-5' RNA ligase family protein [Actinoplanes sp. TRM 88003]|uniref:2'-5' RNA ligase family protein n=1 Tax=Paractinoplanes aksuensis TaxID=2939490 RepID=A0ABT1DW75_9ACTN|nr:2'-5' RNA ligase family protein [Actinoplanes aksuensis]